MRVISILFLALLNSIFFVGCASSQKSSILEERAQYNVYLPSINPKKANSLKPIRASERTTLVWIHPKSLPNRDFFWGAWVSVVYQPMTYEKVLVPKRSELAPKKPELSNKRK